MSARLALRGSRAGRIVALSATVAAVTSAGPLAAQDTGANPVDVPAWLEAWSPLQWTAELPRGLPSAVGSLPRPVLWGLPRTGQFWSAGNPAALPFELSDNRSVYRGTEARASGDYRRPLDPQSSTDAGLSAVAWRPFEGHGAAIGRVRVAHVGLASELSDYDLAYPASPYVVMDTAGSALARTDASLEGALGWRLGPLGVGVALGYRAQQTRTEAAPVPRVLSAADPGASAGVVWRFSPRLRLGVTGRWRAHAERVLLYSIAAASRVYWLQGYYEARPQDIADGWYQRRLERDGLALNVSAAGEAAGAAWTAFVERGGQQERQAPPGQNDPAWDTWTTDAWTVGAAVRRAPAAARVQLAISGRYTTLSGQARRGDLPDTVTFLSDESVFDGAADMSVQASGAVRVLGRLTVRHEDRNRRDQIAALRSELQSWTTGLGVAAAYRPASSLTVALGGALAKYGAGGAIPDPTGLGVVYRTYVAPELSLEATDALAWAASLSALWSVLPGGSLWLRVAPASLSPASSAAQLPLLPAGDRTAWTVEVGVVAGGNPP
jgi:Family of unknown function (DUF6850)